MASLTRWTCNDYNTYADELEAFAAELGSGTDSQGYTAQDYLDAAAEYRNYNDATLAVLDLSKMSTFKTAWENLGTSISNVSGFSYSTFKTRVLRNSLRFGVYQNTYRFDIYDAQDVIDNIGTYYSSVSRTAIQSALDQVVVYNGYGNTYTENNQDPCGLCFFSKDNGYAWSNRYVTSSSNTAYPTWYTIMTK